MLKYRSWLLRTLDTLVYAPLYLLGFYDQNQLRRVQLFKGYKESAYTPTALMVVSIDNADVQVYDVTVAFSVQLYGLRYYMYHWRVCTAFVCTAFLWSIIFTAASSSWLALRITSKKLGKENELHHRPAPKAATAIAQQQEQSLPNDRLAPAKTHIRLKPANHATIDVDNHTGVTNLGVTPLDSSDMANHEGTVRRRNHPAEQPST